MTDKKLIQLIGYRPGIDKITKEPYIWQKHFSHISVSSVESLFRNIEKIVEFIPEKERWNVHYTNANCLTPTPDKSVRLKEFAYQEMMIFDLDDIDMGRIEAYIEIVFRILKVDKDKTGIVNSGHGLHFIIALDQPITSGKEIERLKKYYTAICRTMDQEFFINGLKGETDKIRLMEAATLRLPLTMNIKAGFEPVMCTLIQRNVEKQSFSLQELVGDLPEEELAESENRVMQAVDTPAVLNGCKFLKHSLANAAQLSEPEWYATIGILAYIPDIGRELCHTYSRSHAGYDFDLTEDKIDQALGLNKPRKCASIEQIFSGCQTCQYYRKCKTPLSIKSEEFIGTANTGFHTIHLDEQGNPKKYIPNYDDLVKFYKREHTFVVSRETGILHKYNGTHWEQTEKADNKAFATTYFKPTATNKLRDEFIGLLYSTNVVSEEFFNRTTEGYINFKNCVLRIDGRIQLPHSHDYGFQYCLPYDYNPFATCPAFLIMMNSITLGDRQLEKVLLEFMAYSISNLDPAWGEKALILDGNGSNGKSTFLDVIRNLVGANCYSSVPLADLNDPVGRQVTLGKLFNICEETEYDDLKKAAMFKAIVTGGTTTFKKLYHQPITTKFRSKIILACNKIPTTHDDSDGVYRRLLIVPFRNKYSKDKGNLDKTIRARVFEEMSGVYNVVLDAYDRLIEQKGFTEADASEKALQSYKKEVDVVAQFMEECIEYTNDPDDFLTVQYMQEVFMNWGIRNNVYAAKNMSSIVLSRRFKLKIGIDDTEIKRVDGKSHRGYTGYRVMDHDAY